MSISSMAIYHFGDPGPMDGDNPIHNMTPRLKVALYDLAIGRMPDPESLQKLEKLHMVKDGHLTFPFFLKEDVASIMAFRREHGRRLADIILNHKGAYHDLLPEGVFSKERRLYHLLACDVLDGHMLTYLSEAGIITLSKGQPNGRDYLLIGFEDHEAVLGISDCLLCSCNHLKTPTMSFISFGDSNGQRLDFYRQLRDQDYGPILAMAEANIRAYLKTGLWQEDESLKYLKAFDYVKAGQLKVPVFQDMAQSQALMDLTVALIGPALKDILCAFKNLPLRALNHGVPINDIANELYHQIFGQINEYLMTDGFYEEVQYLKGQGRYHKALIVR